MTDRPLFMVDAEGRWRLAYDANQWVLQRKKGRTKIGMPANLYEPCRNRQLAAALPLSGSSSAACRR